MQVGEDSRPYMRRAYAAVTAATPAEVVQATRVDGAAPPDTFYLLLYRGLLLEALGDSAASTAAIEAARATDYGRRYVRKDYMVDLAAVHCTQRQSGTAAA